MARDLENWHVANTGDTYQINILYHELFQIKRPIFDKFNYGFTNFEVKQEFGFTSRTILSKLLSQQ